MHIHSNFELKPYNTFGIAASAEFFTRIQTIEQAQELVSDSNWKERIRLVLGGGSNILLTQNVQGLVVKNELKGIKVVEESTSTILVEAAAGETWHPFVQYCIAHDWAGLENLSLIPGCVGASPMQNIGAYGVELKDVFERLTALHIPTGAMHTFTKADCAFAYRESVFKRKFKGEYLICSVVFRLSKNPVFHTSYGAIATQLAQMGITSLSIRAIADAVIAIRTSKLPDPAQIGNAGSFFKNPELSNEAFLAFQQNHPNAPAYPLPNGGAKVAAGWLIEQCGWKGKRIGDCGVHTQQALVLVNYGNATGAELLALSNNIINTVADKFGIQLEREVNLL